MNNYQIINILLKLMLLVFYYIIYKVVEDISYCMISKFIEFVYKVMIILLISLYFDIDL